MACKLCGSSEHECVGLYTPQHDDPYYARQLIGGPTGWCCPACGKGNAPGVQGCVHCAEREQRVTYTVPSIWIEDGAIKGAGDVPKGGGGTGPY